jgi:hypothetical protein
MIKCRILFEVQTEFLNIIYASFDFKKLLVSVRSEIYETALTWVSFSTV